MSYFVAIGYTEVRCETVEEAVRLAMQVSPGMGRIVRRQEERQSIEQLPRITTAETPSSTDSENRQMALYRQSRDFLTTIKKSGTDGIAGEVLARRMELCAPSALGTVVANLRRHLQHCNTEVDDVVSKSRIDNKKMWAPGAKLDVAIREIDRLIELEQLAG